MITRIKVSGFKNLVDVDIHLGPFTCIAGLNGVGKSNLFDAIRFLSASASMTLMDAASRIRDEGGRPTDIGSLFTQRGDSPATSMTFEVEMLTATKAVDDLGAPAQAKANFLRYKLELKYRNQGGNGQRMEAFEIVHEALTHIPKGDVTRNLPFATQAKSWKKSLVHVEHRSAPFISTELEDDKTVIKIHQDGGSSGRPKTLASNLPRTVLSIANAAESPTALCARREMESWMFLQLEPSSLRKVDELTSPKALTHEGAHLPASLYALVSEARAFETNALDAAAAEAKVYATVANRLRELIDGIRNIRIDRDEKRDILTLEAIDENGTAYPAKALSDGTLRFLALAILEYDSSGRNVICLEEPENGIHPTRIPAMLRLLQDIATDLDEVVDSTNPPRQVIINTHSPVVVRCIPEDSLVLAKSTQYLDENNRVGLRLQFKQLPDTWRTAGHPGSNEKLVTKGELLSYLGGGLPQDAAFLSNTEKSRRRPRLVAERDDMQLPLGLPFE
jgi:predicted ATPase